MGQFRRNLIVQWARLPIGKHLMRLFPKAGPFKNFQLHDVRFSSQEVEFVTPCFSVIHARHTPRRLEIETSHHLFRYTSH